MGDKTLEDIKKGNDIPSRPNNTPSSGGITTETRELNHTNSGTTNEKSNRR